MCKDERWARRRVFLPSDVRNLTIPMGVAMRRHTMPLLLCFLAVATHANGQQPRPDSALVLRGVTVIDGTGRPPQPGRSLVIVNGRVSAIVAAGSAPPAGARVLDLAGRFVIPGLVDAHVHVTSPFIIPEQQDSLLAFLFDSGVTSVRDLAGEAVMLRERAQLATSAALPSPRIFYSALMAGREFLRTESRAPQIARGQVPGDAAWLKGLTDTTDLQIAIAAAKLTGATGIKLYADLAAPLVSRAAAEAHRQGMKVWSHAAIVPAKPSDAVAAGVDVISHISYLVYEGNDPMPASVRLWRGMADYAGFSVNAPVITRLLQSMKERGTMLDATLIQVDIAGARAEADPGRPDLHSMRSWSFAMARRAHEFGIPFVTGTDFMGRPAIDSVAYVHDEIELMVTQAGMSPVQAISAATLNGARSVGREKDQGTIEPGMLADLVVLSADPTLDIRNTRSILFIVKGGHVHERALSDHIRQLAASRSSGAVTPPDTLVWIASWPGTQMSVMRGNPAVRGQEFRFRFRMPDDYWIPSHAHPTRATIRIISGEFLVGMGNRIDESSARAYGQGGTAVIETGMSHFEGTRGATVIEVSGIGPWGITFLDPKAVPGVRRR